MEQDKEIEVKEYEELTVDFSKQALKRIERANDEQQLAVGLILDHNEIQRLDNLETYPNLKRLSIINNQLIRMYGVSHLTNLVTLDLSSNSLVVIEGLKDLKQLKHLNLSKNRIKTMEHLNNNLKLEKIDLSENNIIHISNIAYLENLKDLNLHGNRINHLAQCEKKLPKNLEVLTLNNNSLSDLNEISHLVNLALLRELSIVNNPCLDFSEDQKFNYRPFVKNWCTNLFVLDNQPLDDIECLKAEWLYSHGRGRSFRPGEHAALIEYLVSVCPKEVEESADTEDVKKLKLILSKAQLHQQQLRDQLSTGKYSAAGFKSPVLKKKIGVISERMVTSFQDSSSKDLRHSSELMTRSLDSGMIKKSPSKISKTDLNQTPLQTSTTFIPIPDTLISPDVTRPAVASYSKPFSLSSRTSHSSKNSLQSTPESKRKISVSTSALRRQNENTSPITLKRLERPSYSTSSAPLERSRSPGKNIFPRNVVSPDKKGIKLRESEKSFRETSEEEDSEVIALKIKAVQQKVNQRRQYRSFQTEKRKENIEGKDEFQKNKPSLVEKDIMNIEEWKAAICIQKRWRGYRVRNLNKEVVAGCKNIQMSRMQDYIGKVIKDMESTRIALEGNKKLAILQMQAINALWKKMTTLQPSVCSNLEDKTNLQELVRTCSVLNKQVEELQTMMKAMQTSSDSNLLIPMATQTEIVAVHTPQGEGKEKFPYNHKLKPQSTENLNSTDLVERKEKDQERTYDSSNNSTENEVNNMTELYMNSSINDESGRSLSDEKNVSFNHEKLTTPTVKLNHCGVPLPSPDERDRSKGDEEFQNTSKS